MQYGTLFCVLGGKERENLRQERAIWPWDFYSNQICLGQTDHFYVYHVVYRPSGLFETEALILPTLLLYLFALFRALS